MSLHLATDGCTHKKEVGKAKRERMLFLRILSKSESQLEEVSD